MEGLEFLSSPILRSPSVYDSSGGAISEKQARERNRMLKVADQAAEMAYNSGLQVSESIARSLDSSKSANTSTIWGKFEPAIRRWEATLGRPAPLPTKADGKDGNHRLSSKFTEWMMGVPEGWVTDVGLKRNDELKACGNGVVPQQAELALRGLLKGLI